jgi:hypothetical protein
MKNISFTKEEKAQLFDEIAGHFYNANFGQLSKSDMELMMFHFYVDKLISDNQNPDGTIDYRKCSDYKISKDLGITQQRVRNLKVKKQLIYPIQYDWKSALATLTENARYDKDSKKVVLNIPDPNLYLEIQNFIEENGAYVEKQLNSKVLQIRAEYYIDLIITLEPEGTRKSIIKALKEQFKESGKEDSKFDERNIGKSLIDNGANITTIAANISSIISPENKVGIALISLLLTGVSTLTEHFTSTELN